MNVYMVSLGCAKNQVDSEMILGAMKDSITTLRAMLMRMAIFLPLLLEN